MDCLTETSCTSNLLDVLNQLAATIDYCGLVLFGDLWSPIGPDVEAGVEAIADFFNPTWLGDESKCTQYAKRIAHRG